MSNIQFEHIDPYIEGQGGDTGQSSRLKLRRNFEKIKAWMDSVASQLSGKFLKKDGDDTAEGVITFLQGSLFGPNGAWGWVKRTLPDRVGEGWAWFRNLLADRLSAVFAEFSEGADVTGRLRVFGDMSVSGQARIEEIIARSILSEGYQGDDLVGGGGFKMAVDPLTGKATVFTDFLNVRTKLLASSAEIRKVTYSSGTLVVSGAGSEAAQVKPVGADGGRIDIAPAEYEALEYLEKTGDPGYFITKYYPNNRTRIEAEYLLPSGVGQTATLWCSRTDASYTAAKPSFSMWPIISSNNYTRMEWRNRQYNGALMLTDEFVKIVAEGGQLTYQAESGEVTIGEAVSDEWEAIYPLALWVTRNRTSAVSSYRGRGKLKRFTISEDGVTLYDYLPARRLRDGTLGLYDLVNNTFIGTTYTDTTIFGGPVAEAPDNDAFRPHAVDYDKGDVYAWRVYCTADDGTTATMNDWHVGDQVLCQTFNIKAGVYENVSNRYWWRLALQVGQEQLEDGKTYSYVDVASDKLLNIVKGQRPEAIYSELLEGAADGTVFHGFATISGGLPCDAPAIGDTMAQEGSQKELSRQGFALIKADGLLSGYYIYAGVNDFTLEGKMVMQASPDLVSVSARKFRIFSGNNVGDTYPLTVYKGAWNAQTRYYLYDEVTYGGSTWVCIWPSDTGFVGGDPPSEGSDTWQLYIAKGQDGRDGDSGTSRWMVVEPSSVRVYRDDNYNLRTSEDISDEIQVTLYEQTNGVTRKVRDDAHFSVNGMVNVKNGQPEYPVCIFINTKTYPSSDGVLRWDETNSLYYLYGGLTEDIKFSSLIFLWESSVGSAFARYEMPLSVDGEQGANGADGADGKNGAAFMLSPSEFVITEKCNDNAGWSGNWDVANNAVVAVASCKVGTTSPEVTITAVKLEGTNTDSNILSRQNSTTGKANLKINTNALNNDSSIRSHSVDVTLSATVNGVATTHTLRFRLYVNRLGTLKSETIGDATTTIREKTGWVVDPDTGEWKEMAYKSDVVDAADRFSRELSSIPISRNLLLNSDFDEEAESGRGAIHIVPTRRWQGYQQESRNAQGDWVARLTRNKKYTLSIYARGSGYGGAIVHLINVSTGETVQADYIGIDIQNLTSHWKRYSVTFTVPSTANRGFRVRLGSMYGSAAAISGADIEIARPQLEEGEKATLYTATGSRNMLANSKFDNISKNKPEGWTYWENEESGSIVEPTTREIIAEKVLALWGEWNGTGKTTAPKVQEIRVDGANGWKYLHVEPSEMFQGLVQDSSARSNGTWKGVLVHGVWYVLSFYARGQGRIDGLLHLVKTSGQHISQPQPMLSVEVSDSCESDVWTRYEVSFQAIPSSSSDYDLEHGYGFSLMLGCAHYSEDPDYEVPDEVIEIARPQLEEGRSASDWRRGEENPELVATRFEQTAQKMELAVYRDGVKRSGMKIDEDGVELDGKTTKINGDLDLQGLTTENVTPVTRMKCIPTVVNMGVVAADDLDASHVVKSVQVKGTADFTHIVTLPFYDAGFQEWAQRIGTPFNADGSFPLFGNAVNGVEVADWQRMVQPWKKNGTRLVITNEVINKYRNWQSITEASEADLLGGMVLVCSDPRVICAANLNNQSPFIPTELGGQYLSLPELHAGRFSCNGDAARFVWLLPGQSLLLRSQILDMQGRDVLIWVVENPSEFERIPHVQLRFQDGEAGGLNYITTAEAVFNPRESLTSTHESVLAPKAFGLQTRNGQRIYKEFETLYYYWE